MKKEAFRSWLINDANMNGHQVSDHLSRIKRIENVYSTIDGLEFDVDKECKKDLGESLLARLSFSKRQEYSPDVNLPNDHMGMSRLRSSLRKYIEFYKCTNSIE